jgi:hypothetical protein
MTYRYTTRIERETYCIQFGSLSTENGGSMILQDACVHLQAHTALQPRRPSSTL